MPSSFHYHLSKMVDWIVKVQPQSVLDIGVGFGKWGFLAREYTDIFANRYDRSQWKVRIDGVEAFPAYATPMYDYIYNTIYHATIQDILPTLPDYDLVIIGDVIEHFTKEEGQALLAALCKKSRFILLSSPTVYFDQDIMDNVFETHKSLWTAEDFQAFQFDYDEYDHWLFVALLRGDLATAEDMPLNGWPARVTYSKPWIKKRPKLAQMAKTFLRRFPQARHSG